MQAANSFVRKQQENPEVRFAFGADSYFWKRTFNARASSRLSSVAISEPSKKSYHIRLAWKLGKEVDSRSKISQAYQTLEEAVVAGIRFRLVQEFNSDGMVKRNLIDCNTLDEIEQNIRLVLSKYQPEKNDNEIIANLARMRQ